jgi:hypothetical protein
VPSRIGTPAVGIPDTDGTAMSAKENGAEPGEKKEEGAEGGTDSTAVTLPVEVQQKLRKLERLEPKYSGNFTQWHRTLLTILTCAQIY